jgi:hypothetical protein
VLVLLVQIPPHLEVLVV